MNYNYTFLKLTNCSSRIICPVLLTGSHSVIPSTIPNSIDFNTSIFSILSFLLFQQKPENLTNLHNRLHNKNISYTNRSSSSGLSITANGFSSRSISFSRNPQLTSTQSTPALSAVALSTSESPTYSTCFLSASSSPIA